MTIYATSLVALSVVLVAAIRQDTWDDTQTAVVALVFALVAFLLGSYLDGTLVVPPTTENLKALLPAFLLAIGEQQGLHRIMRNFAWFQAIETIGSKPAVSSV
jgi:hypothetical protein